MYDQGFRKVHPDRWEFANEGFLRGQKHLLKTIKRRKTTNGPVQQQAEQMPLQTTPSANACVEVGKFGLEEEVEMLKRDRNILMQELVKLRQHQQSTDKQLQVTVDRLHGMEQRHQQLMSFLAKAVQRPGFFTQFVHQQGQNNRIIIEANKKRRLKHDDISIDDPSSNPGGQIVKYQPSLNDTLTFDRQMMDVGDSSQAEVRNSDHDNLLFRDASAFSGQQGDSFLDRVSKSSLPEVHVSSMQFSPVPTSVTPPPGSSAEQPDVLPSSVTIGSEVGTMVHYPPVSTHVGVHDNLLSASMQSEPVSLLPSVVPESVGEDSNDDSLQFDLSAFGSDEVVSFDFESISYGDDTTDMSASPWNMELEEFNPAQLGNLLFDNNASENNRNIDHLTDQMELLSSSAKNSDETHASLQNGKA